jgi:hypothetical protein
MAVQQSRSSIYFAQQSRLLDEEPEEGPLYQKKKKASVISRPFRRPIILHTTLVTLYTLIFVTALSHLYASSLLSPAAESEPFSMYLNLSLLPFTF